MKPTNPTLDEAADWLIRIDAGALDSADERQLALWRQQSPDHERAWQAARKLKSMLGALPPGLGNSTLGRPHMDRRSLLKSLAALTIVPSVGWMGYTRAPWELWHADIRTAKGEQKTISLPEGGELLVNTDSVLDVAYDDHRRTVRLYRGEIRITSAQGAGTEGRPLVVATEQGEVNAQAAQFAVRTHMPGLDQNDCRTSVSVLSKSVEVRPSGTQQDSLVSAGRQVLFSDHKVYPSRAVSADAQAWVEGQLIADNQPLGTFLSELGRYRPGLLRVDPAVADLAISGVFQLKSTDQVLDVLARTLPIRIRRVTDYWVTVTPA